MGDDKVSQRMLPIHSGGVAGLADHIVIRIAGMIAALLILTGIDMRWKKRAARSSRQHFRHSIAGRRKLHAVE
ncbi:hypothetical protein RN629_16690 [Sphingomonadaceae bacterium jetA1]|jgi:uncharacterized iron-regulated membrane protein|uniref:hypothetical protein n=1 Tax=Facivitalis istanbulensis TaxID=3075838 RepID=UPI003481EB01